ncbi:MAG: hypothetical protein WA323_15155 [Candidatus Nitrosopolaris sp.]
MSDITAIAAPIDVGASWTENSPKMNSTIPAGTSISENLGILTRIRSDVI